MAQLTITILPAALHLILVILYPWEISSRSVKPLKSTLLLLSGLTIFFSSLIIVHCIEPELTDVSKI